MMALPQGRESTSDSSNKGEKVDIKVTLPLVEGNARVGYFANRVEDACIQDEGVNPMVLLRGMTELRGQLVLVCTKGKH